MFTKVEVARVVKKSVEPHVIPGLYFIRLYYL